MTHMQQHDVPLTDWQASRKYLISAPPPTIRRSLESQPLTEALAARDKAGLTITDIDWWETVIATKGALA